MGIDDRILLKKMCLGDKEAYTLLFQFYYKNLVIFASSFIRDVTVCEDIVQNIFIKLWTNRSTPKEIESLRSYLLKSTQNACLSYIRHLKVRNCYDDYILLHSIDESYSADDYILYSEFNERLDVMLQRLSTLHRNCFIMGKMEGKKYAEVAIELNVSVRTVELKIAESLKFIRTQFKDYLTILSIFI